MFPGEQKLPKQQKILEKQSYYFEAVTNSSMGIKTIYVGNDEAFPAYNLKSDPLSGYLAIKSVATNPVSAR
ncbi:hypothetical protein Dd586_0348 [Dickeya parazeae Ech586]|uniref:Uncharacterized protein n=1 Tax=Dickeya zeae (strain Ech586) TaxID=590409 RepID=D2C269_DICZ5|nr:hypothetical protein Dd586_0348 [Dickeya parazeae Ech586]